jgi:hypothetical protein
LRRFLPHLRLQTLTLEEAAVLPANLVNADEKLALIETIVARDATKKPTLPKPLNTSVVSRASACGLKVVLIPEGSPLEPLDKIKVCKNRISNSVWLTPKMDVCLTEIEILSEEFTGQPYREATEFKVTLKLVDKETKKFISFQLPTKSELKSHRLQKIEMNQWILKKDKQVCIKVVYAAGGYMSGDRRFKDVSKKVVYKQLKMYPLSGFSKIDFATSRGAPAFVKSISYAIASSVNGGDILNSPLGPLNDTSSEDEIDEDDDDDSSYSS